MTAVKTNRLFLLICLVLALGTVALYWPVTRHPFITLDDQQYVTQNSHVQSGLTWAGVKWAFSNFEAANWHPLTWLSHQLDCELFGLNAGGHHLMNVLLHTANALLVFGLLRGATGAVWRSAIVAALFAWHPLRVESVAWTAERKDVLCAFFFLLAMIFYLRSQKRDECSVTSENNFTPHSSLVTRRKFFWLAWLAFALSLLSKPMAVTLPFVLLLLDVWPLNRFPLSAFRFPLLKTLLLEKIPFFVLAVAVSVVTLVAQKSGQATWSLSSLPLTERLANAALGYAGYLSKTFWPVDLAIIYSFPKQLPWLAAAGAAAGLLFVSGLVLKWAQRKPYLFTGWFYFLVTLLPVIGLVQVGPQALADRYMYLPSIGLFVLLVWGGFAILSAVPHAKTIATVIAVSALGLCVALTAQQLNFWTDSVKLFSHCVAVTGDNYTACDYLGGALKLAGAKDDALVCFAKSVALEPRFTLAQYDLGLALLEHNQFAEAAEHLGVAAHDVPNDPLIYQQYGRALLGAGKLSEAETELTTALRLKPDFFQAHADLAVALAGQKKFAEAIPHFRAVVTASPDNPQFRFNLGLALLDNRQPELAAAQFSAQLRLTPDDSRAHFRLAQALERLNNFPDAIQHYREAVRLNPELREAQTALDKISAPAATP